MSSSYTTELISQIGDGQVQASPQTASGPSATSLGDPAPTILSSTAVPTTLSTASPPTIPSTPSPASAATSAAISPDVQNTTTFITPPGLSDATKTGLAVGLPLGLSALLGLLFLIFAVLKCHRRRRRRRRKHEEAVWAVAKRLSTSTTDSELPMYQETIRHTEFVEYRSGREQDASEIRWPVPAHYR